MVERTHDDHAVWLNLGMKLLLFPEYYRFRRRVIDLLQIRAGQKVLDVGCGVGLLEELLCRARPAPGLVIGVDVGPRLLKKAAVRLANTGHSLHSDRNGNPGCGLSLPVSAGAAETKESRRTMVSLVQIGSDAYLPVRSGSLDAVVMNLVSHLLPPDRKVRLFAEFFRVLKPGGRAVLAEIGKPSGFLGFWLEFLSTTLWQKLYAYEENTFDNLKGRIPEYLRKAGFRVDLAGRAKGFVDFLVAEKAGKDPL